MLACIDRPTTRRENGSMTAAAESRPSVVQIYVKSAIHFRFGASAANRRSKRSGEAALRSPSSFGSLGPAAFPIRRRPA